MLDLHSSENAMVVESTGMLPHVLPKINCEAENDSVGLLGKIRPIHSEFGILQILDIARPLIDKLLPLGLNHNRIQTATALILEWNSKKM